MYKATQTMPSARFVFLPVFATIKIMIVTKIKIAVSMINSGTALIGVNVEAIPRMNKILNRQEPTALPRAIPESPFLEAVIEVTSSSFFHLDIHEHHITIFPKSQIKKRNVLNISLFECD